MKPESTSKAALFQTNSQILLFFIFFFYVFLKHISYKSFLCILLILSGDISLNPGPVYNNQSLHSNEGNVPRSKGIHIIHLNVNE